MAKRNADHKPAEVFPPGEFIREELDARGWTQKEFADILGRPAQTVNQIIMGKKEITPDTAVALAEALGTSAELWLNLESTYRLASASKPAPGVARRARLRSLAPVNDLLRRGWIRARDTADELEAEVCAFLEINSIEQRPTITMAARRGDDYDELTPGQIAWAFRAKHLASAASAAKYDHRRCETLVPTLPQLSPRPTGIRDAVSALAKVGVRVVHTPHLPRTKIDGGAFWLDAASPVVAISLRYDRLDSFWFTLMHELAHVLEGHALVGYLDEDLFCGRDEGTPAKPDCEQKADRLASEWLIAEEPLRRFISSTAPYYSSKRVEALAAAVGVHPGIVVGRLQHLQEVPYGNLRRFLVKASELWHAND